jgi:CRP-like cAMP-binding protein
MRPVEYADGESIYRYGEEADLLAQITSGLVELGIVSAEGKEILVHIMQPGDCFGEMGLIDESARAQTASARGATTLSILHKQDFLSLRRQYPEINEELVKMQTRRIRMLLLFLEKSTLSGLRQILAQRLLALANMFGEKQGDAITIRAKLSQEELGKMVGASRQSINKELSYLQEQNILQLLPDGFLLKDPEALKQLC